MAIPQKLVPKQMLLGDDNFMRKTVELYAAASNSQVKYGQGDHIVFQIPNYARSFIDFSKSYLRFDLKTTATSGKCRVNEGLPVFTRCVMKCGNKTIMDIDSYETLEKVLNLTMVSKNDQSPLYGQYLDSGITTVNTIQSAGETYCKRLYGGVFDAEGYFPVHRLNTGNGLEYELTVSPNEIALLNDGSAVDPSYEISNVRMVLSLLHVSDEFFNKFNSIANEREISLPVTLFRRHVATVPSQTTTPMVHITDNTRNLKRSYTVFKKVVGSVGTTLVQPAFYKGKSSTERVTSYIFRYGSRAFPESPIENSHQLMLASALASVNGSMRNALPAIATGKQYEDNFMIIQDYSWDPEINSGLNMNASGSPLLLELKLLANPNTISVETFTESSGEVVIDQFGNVGLSQKTLIEASV